MGEPHLPLEIEDSKYKAGGFQGSGESWKKCCLVAVDVNQGGGDVTN